MYSFILSGASRGSCASDSDESKKYDLSGKGMLCVHACVQSSYFAKRVYVHAAHLHISFECDVTYSYLVIVSVQQ